MLSALSSYHQSVQRFFSIIVAACLTTHGLSAQEARPPRPAVSPGEACTPSVVATLRETPAANPQSVPGGAPIACHPIVSPLSRYAQDQGSDHFDISGNSAALNLTLTELGDLFDEVYEYVSERTGVRVDGLIRVSVRPAIEVPCPPRGRASNQDIELFADANWSRAQLLGVFAHELGHVLQFREIPGIGRLGGQFGQGYASWAAGRYWTEWQGFGSFHAAVAHYIEQSIALPLDTGFQVGMQADLNEDAAGDCIARRDIVLTQWASLIDFLVARYGRDGFYARAEAAPAPDADGVDYPAIFEREFEELEAEWRETVRAQR